MKPSYSELQMFSPLRRADWRWRRASDLVERHRYFFPHRDDVDTGRAVRYLQRLGRSARSHSARTQFPDIDSAHALHREGGAKKVLVEARFLARQSPAEIAQVTKLPVEVVVRYKALFFNVVDRLERSN